MKKDVLISFILVAFLLLSCNSGKSSNGITADSGDSKVLADISFKEFEHEFGKVNEGEKVACVFSFLNKGPGNLVIASASTTCGCTVSRYDTKPILPGEGGNLEVVFDTSGRNGMQTKTISVKSNSKTPVVILKITAEIIANNNN